MNPFSNDIQVDPLLQGLLERQGSGRETLQIGGEKSGGQMHDMLLPMLLQVPPFRQGLTRQGGTPHSATMALESLSINAVCPDIPVIVKLVIMQPSNPVVMVTLEGSR